MFWASVFKLDLKSYIMIDEAKRLSPFVNIHSSLFIQRKRPYQEIPLFFIPPRLMP